MLPTDITIRIVQVAKPKEDLVDRDLYQEDVEKLLGYFKQKQWFTFTMLSVLTSTGMRIEELLRAKWRDIHT
ncbi:tyrosine-type recombinase/integrase [Alteribacillus bidgolensis]|uniref:tyrosine-type recombinase/integrase n=1 Tax=Alteribacillus bidgolensis TaxID=930129 RepID=UPI000B88151D|nr:tyrosine-type recombinase/integrase [Alteribacillus bidgolensis]